MVINFDGGGEEFELIVDFKSVEFKELYIFEFVLEEKYLIFQENQKGILYDCLFGLYLSGVGKIIIMDFYIWFFYQICNFMEFFEVIVKNKVQEDEVVVYFVIVWDEFKGDL